MSLKRIKNNVGYFLAGAILFGVVVNVYMEFNSNTDGREPKCLYSSTQ
jgi:hypothetical protein